MVEVGQRAAFLSVVMLVRPILKFVRLPKKQCPIAFANHVPMIRQPSASLRPAGALKKRVAHWQRAWILHHVRLGLLGRCAPLKTKRHWRSKISTSTITNINPSPPLGPYPQPRLYGHAGAAPNSKTMRTISNNNPMVGSFRHKVFATDAVCQHTHKACHNGPTKITDLLRFSIASPRWIATSQFDSRLLST